MSKLTLCFKNDYGQVTVAARLNEVQWSDPIFEHFAAENFLPRRKSYRIYLHRQDTWHKKKSRPHQYSSIQEEKSDMKSLRHSPLISKFHF